MKDDGSDGDNDDGSFKANVLLSIMSNSICQMFTDNFMSGVNNVPICHIFILSECSYYMCVNGDFHIFVYRFI